MVKLGNSLAVSRLGACTLTAILCATPLVAQDIEFRITPGHDQLESGIRGASLLLESQRNERTTPEDLFSAARADYARIVNALYGMGHYSSVVHILIDGREAASIAPIDAPARIGQISVSVDPGPAFAFSTARVAPTTPATTLPEGFAPGKPALSGLVKDAVSAGVEGWRTAGHAKAAVAAQRLAADHASRQLSADVTLEPGPRLRFGPLVVTGQQRMRERRIHEIAGLPEGEVFNPADLRRSAERLRRTGVFRSVTLREDDAITPPDLLGITATLVEEKPRHYAIGAEISSFEGLDLSALWMHRNLLGGAERLTVEGEITNIAAQRSGTDYTLGVTLDRPATLTPDTMLSLHAEVSRLDEEDYDADLASAGFTFSHFFSDRLTGQAGLQYNYGEVTVDLGDRTQTTIFKDLALPIGLIWDSRDDRLDATKGLYLDAKATPFLGFGSTDSGAQLKLDSRAYVSFGDRRPVTLAGRAQVGAVFGTSLLGTPRDYLFYSGGGGTVRGQPYQSLGVNVLRIAGDDYKTGGMAFLAVSGEVRTRVTDRIGIVGFVDAGHVGALDFFDGIGDWHAGAGLGLRYDTGFGPLRLDIAAPVAGDTGDGVQIYIGIGQAF